MGDPEVHRERPLSRRLVNDTALADALIEQGVCDRDGILHALLTALDTFDQDMAARYTDHVLAVLTEAARDHLEALMTAGTYEYKSDFARRYYTKGEVRALLAILNARGIPVTDDVHARITACTDLDHLDTWVRRASTATTIQDLF